MKLIKSEEFIKKQFKLENDIISKMDLFSNIQKNNSIEEFGLFNDNNHFLGVLIEEIKEATDEFNKIKVLFNEIQSKIFSNELTQDSQILKDLLISQGKMLIELIQVNSVINKYFDS